jgi:hypothetical protein
MCQGLLSVYDNQLVMGLTTAVLTIVIPYVIYRIVKNSLRMLGLAMLIIALAFYALRGILTLSAAMCDPIHIPALQLFLALTAAMSVPVLIKLVVQKKAKH